MTQVPPPLPSENEPQWWFSRAGTSHGPVSFQELVDKVALSEVGPLELVWNRHLPGWTSVERVPELATHLPPPNLAATRVYGHRPPPPVAAPVESPVPLAPAASTPSQHDAPPRASTAQRVLARAYNFVYFALLALVPVGLLGQPIADTLADLRDAGPLWASSLVDLVLANLIFAIWLFVAALFEGLSYFSISQTSRGKEWMGLEVRKSNGDLLTASEHFRRQLRLFFQGYGAGMPLALLIAAPYQLYRLVTGKPTTYDANHIFVAKVNPMDWRAALTPLSWIVFAVLVLAVAGVLFQMLGE